MVAFSPINERAADRFNCCLCNLCYYALGRKIVHKGLGNLNRTDLIDEEDLICTGRIYLWY